MKKEKKAVIKNSEYYYKKCSTFYTFSKMFLIGIVPVIGMVIALKNTTADNTYKEMLIKQESGYSEYIENEKASLKEKRENDEISQNVYEAYLEDLNNETLEGYLKKTDNAYYLAEYQKNEKEKAKEANIIYGTTIGIAFTLATAEIISFYATYRKANKLKVQEYDETLDKNLKDFDNSNKNHQLLLDNSNENAYTELK